MVGNARDKHKLNPIAIVDAGESWRFMVSFGAKLRAGNAVITSDCPDSKPNADAIREDFGGVSDVGAGPLVAVPVGAQSHPVVQTSVNAGVDVAQPSMLVTANSVKPNRLCASQHREQKQENEAEHDALLCDERSIVSFATKNNMQLRTD
jgi:hypothetical protein